MNIKSIRHVSLCGGSGTRLWPLSRSGFPKQFLCLTGERSLFQQSVERLASLSVSGFVVDSPLIVSSEDHRFLVQEQLREIGVEPGAVLLEPIGRNTAPALTLAAMAAMHDGADPILIVTPADQVIAEATPFVAAVETAIREAAIGAIVVLGIAPNRPEIGYGYMQTITTARDAGTSLDVSRFVEKPDATTAQSYLDEGNYYWNAGIFVLKASVWLQALKTFRPDILEAVQRVWQSRTADGIFVRPEKAEFASIPSESIDYAVMQSCPGTAIPVKMVPLVAGWSDLGSWDAVWEVLPKDANRNAYLGDVLAIDGANNLVHANSRLVSLVGVKDLIVVETADAILIADKSRCQDVKSIVTSLQASDRDESSLHRKVHRPWGWYDEIDFGERFKVKRIQVKPNASLSLQKHSHRAEHWVVVTGTAEITNGDKTLILTENQSTYIPRGEVHRLVNIGSEPLEIIEVQSGSYLGEDDIVRLDDEYGRS